MCMNIYVYMHIRIFIYAYTYVCMHTLQCVWFYSASPTLYNNMDTSRGVPEVTYWWRACRRPGGAPCRTPMAAGVLIPPSLQGEQAPDRDA